MRRRVAAVALAAAATTSYGMVTAPPAQACVGEVCEAICLVFQLTVGCHLGVGEIEIRRP